LAVFLHILPVLLSVFLSARAITIGSVLSGRLTGFLLSLRR
jgi:hypothetical protein